MEDFLASTYGDRIADIYDELHAGQSSPDNVGPVVDTLAELAGKGPALELGVGTGRIALPLAERGVEVHGIDASELMLNKLRQKPGGTAIRLTLGDFEELGVGSEYSLIYVVFNTIFAPLTQEAQVRCFKNVARHLTDEGVFLVEAFVPDLGRFAGGQSIRPGVVGADAVSLDVSRHDAVAQTITASHLHITESGVRLYPVKFRYAWPSELDLMARLAGLGLQLRASDWRGSPFTASSSQHVSVYRRQSTKATNS